MQVLYEREVPLRLRWGLTSPDWCQAVQGGALPSSLARWADDALLRKALRDWTRYTMKQAPSSLPP